MTKSELKKCLEVCKDGCSINCPLFDGDFGNLKASTCIDYILINCYKYLKDEESVKDILNYCISEDGCSDDCPLHRFRYKCLKTLLSECLELL